MERRKGIGIGEKEGKEIEGKDGNTIGEKGGKWEWKDRQEQELERGRNRNWRWMGKGFLEKEWNRD